MNLKRSLSFTIYLSIVFSFLFNNQAIGQFSGGDGSSSNPYQISSPTELDSVRNYPGDHFILINDIDMDISPYNSLNGWAPIGTNSNPFYGNIDGAGYTINNLFIDNNTLDYVGLFGKADSGFTVKNLNLSGIDVTGQNNTSGLAGYTQDVIITNVHVSGSLTGITHVGMLVGYIESNTTATIDSSSSAGSINGNNSVGGLIGTAYGTTELKYSSTTANVTSTSNVGGLIGYSTDSNSVILHSNSTGDITGNNTVGGLAAQYRGSVEFSFSTSTITTTGSDITGGLVGYQTNGNISRSYFSGKIISSGSYVGGVAGRVNGVVMENTFSSGLIKGNNYVGALVGFIDNGTITESYSAAGTTSNQALFGNTNGSVADVYWNTDIHGNSTSWVGTGLNSVEMTQETSFGAFNFDSVWVIQEGASYPYLQQLTPSTLPSYTNYFASGDGSINTPFAISSLEGLENMGVYRFANYELQNDLDLNVAPYNTGEGWLPIGSNNAPFSGNLDGGGYTISNLFIDNSNLDYVGLFGKADSGVTIKNLNLTDIDVTGRTFSSGLAGYTQGGTIKNVHVSGSLTGSSNVGLLIGSAQTISNSTTTIDSSSSDGSVGGSTYLGGLVGIANSEITITYSTSSANVISINTGSYVGGLIGQVSNQNSLIQHSAATGDVSGYSNVGGLAGYSTSTIENSYSTSTITNTGNNNTGGLVGYQYSNSIKWSYYSGTIESSGQRVGGIVGYIYSSIIENTFSDGSVEGTGYIGGLVGYNQYGTISSSYSSAGVSGSQPLVGFTTGGTLSDIYWNTDMHGTSTNWVGTGLSSVEMTDEASFGAFDFDSTWTIQEGASYPYLQQNIPNILPSYSNFFATGNGSINAPFAITNLEGLVNMRVYRFANFELQNDLDLNIAPYNTGEGWKPIGTNSAPFSGNFNGAGYTISNLFIDNSNLDYVGLFGKANSGLTIQNLNLVNIDVTGRNNTSGLVGNTQDAVIKNVHVNGSLTGYSNVGMLVGYIYSNTNITTFIDSSSSAGNVEGRSNVGGVVGSSQSVTHLSYSASTADVTSLNNNGSIGGLIGYSTNSNSLILYSNATGDITGLGSNVGGLVGYNSSTIEYSYSNSEITNTTNSYTGGLVGQQNTGSILASYFSGKVESNGNYVGGIVGRINGGAIEHTYSSGLIKGSNYVGGIIGSNESTTITNSYSVAGVSGGSNTQPLVGYNNNGTLEEVYWNTDIEGSSSTLLGTGLNSNALTRTATFGTFDFDSIWAIKEGESYPYLKELVPSTLPSYTNYFATGNGSINSPFAISTLEDLESMRVYRFAYFELQNDLDLNIAPFNTGEGWLPIGTNNAPFAGKLDGAGYTISNLFIDNNILDYVGLFGKTKNGTSIKNLSLVGIDVTGRNSTSGLIGLSEGVIIKNTHVSGSITGSTYVGLLIGFIQSNANSTTNIDSSSSAGSVEGYSNVGGIIGITYDITQLNHVSSTANVSAISTGGYIGGLVGQISNQNAKIQYSNSSGSISGGSNLGGLVGYNRSTIENSYSTSTINNTNNGSNTGGLVGYQYTNPISSSYYSGNIVSNGGNVGGIVGVLNSIVIQNTYSHGSVAGSNNVAGLVGNNSYGTIKNSYSTASVSGSNNTQPLIGYNYNGTITDIYWNADSSGTSNSWYGSGLTTTEMKQKNSFLNWDFENTWVLLENNALPYLKDNVPNTIPGYLLPFAGGDGSSNYPYLISTIAQLDSIRHHLADNFILANNIDLNSSPYNLGQGWEPIGTKLNPFTGTFSGNNYSINALLIDRNTHYVGLFGYVNGGIIENLNINQSDIAGSTYVGGIAGYIGESSTISNSTVNGYIQATGPYAGGLVGYSKGSTLTSSFATDSVHSDSNFVGGLVGFSNASSITQSYADNKVSGKNGVGGIVGSNDSSSVVSATYSNGIVSGTDEIGGLIGSNRNGSQLNDSYFIGSVTGQQYIGGLVGRSTAASGITNTYSMGEIQGTGKTGGLVGANENSLISSSYLDTLSSGQQIAIGEDDNAQTVTNFSISEMMTSTNFSNWDFTSDSSWAMVDGSSFPYLNKVGTQITIAAAFDGTGGWRTVGQSGEASYDELLSNIWTQGYPGSDTENSTSNVFVFDESSFSWKSPTHSSNNFGTTTNSSSSSMPGALIWFYPDDDADGTDDAWPKYLVSKNNNRNNSSTYVVPLSYSFPDTPDSSGWHLVSNPYSKSLNWRSIIDANENSNIMPVAYIWDHSLNGNNGGYKVNFGYPLPPGSSQDYFFDGNIPVMQSFWVKATGSNASLTFRPEYLETPKNPYKSTVNELLWASLRLTKDEFSDQLLIFKNEFGQEEYNLPKLTTLAGRYAELATFNENGSKLMAKSAINGEEITIPLSINTTESGEFTLVWNDDLQNTHAVLIDQELNKEVRLDIVKTYTFNYSGNKKKSASLLNLSKDESPFLPSTSSANISESRFVLKVLTGVTVDNESETLLPDSFTLSQNYPNPFNPSSTIQFGIPEATEVRLEVFNMLGQRVSTLIAGEKLQAGWHTVQFDAGNLATGMYVYRIVAGNFVQTKRMMLIK